MELKTFISYRQKRKKICFWRTVKKQEVDFIVGDEIAIEVKATKRVSSQHFAGLWALKDEGIVRDFYLVSEDPVQRLGEEFIKIIHWRDFLTKLWSGEVL